MNLDLSGRTALVCGSSSGIGRACAVELAALGASCVLLARDADKLKSAIAELPVKGQKHHALAADLSKPAAARDAVAAWLTQWGVSIHIVINNTGGPPAGAAIDATPDQLLAAFNSQLIAAQMLVQLTVPGMKAAKYGRIINITSTSVKSPIPGLAISNIVRPAVAAWAKCLATELGPHGITVNNILPGYTKTDRLASLFKNRAAKQGLSESQIEADVIASTPAGRLGDPAEIAAAVAFLASPAAAYINGINLPVDGGRLGTL
ncbi:3-oxoacyl-[acyl-carrier protein] reductase [Phycisphaerales bacterium]|nr:3-oxoacyl-[acyl-carrier protein] reductase [Phycisphaerales bacterium]